MREKLNTDFPDFQVSKLSEKCNTKNKIKQKKTVQKCCFTLVRYK